jgi:predicted RNA-binding protein YlqC (UPF0109 family)
VIKPFLYAYANLIVEYPEKMSIEIDTSNDAFDEITIWVDEIDVGKLIGKEGRMINAIKTVISGCKAKGGKSYRLNVKAVD